MIRDTEWATEPQLGRAHPTTRYCARYRPWTENVVWIIYTYVTEAPVYWFLFYLVKLRIFRISDCKWCTLLYAYLFPFTVSLHISYLRLHWSRIEDCRSPWQLGDIPSRLWQAVCVCLCVCYFRLSLVVPWTWRATTAIRKHFQSYQLSSSIVRLFSRGFFSVLESLGLRLVSAKSDLGQTHWKSTASFPKEDISQPGFSLLSEAGAQKGLSSRWI